MEDKKVVFIDNEDFYRKLYKRKLEEKGVRFLEADTGTKGWELIKSENPDLVITEVTVQGKGGFKIAKEMNEDEDLVDTPVIILTSLSQESDKEDGRKLNVADYFVKQEVNLSDVMEGIEKTLN